MVIIIISAFFAAAKEATLVVKNVCHLRNIGDKNYNYFNEIIDELLKLVDEKDVNEYLQSLETSVRFLNKIVRRRI